MALTPGQQNGVSNGTTEVEILAAPAASTQRVVGVVMIHNADTVNATVTVNFEDGATERILKQETLAPNATMVINDPLVLAATDETLEMVLSGAVTTNELPFYVTYMDKT